MMTDRIRLDLGGRLFVFLTSAAVLYAFVVRPWWWGLQ